MNRKHKAMRITRKGSKVALELTGRLENGEIFAVAPKEKPLEIETGKAQVFAPIEKALEGKKPGDSERIWVSPDEAYGKRDKDKVHTLPSGRLAPEIRGKVGRSVKLFRPNGEALNGRIVSAQDDEVVIDCNHPLAGHSLQFDIKVLDVTQAQSEA
jgi:FKBP-type peptidyl-prolyl cis-trans isomerase 2